MAAIEGLEHAVALGSAGIVEQVTESGLRGRGGAGFPTGIKWKTVADTAAPQKYIVCNADEGDSGTFADRMIMEGDPFVLIEGMTIAGIAVGATKGFVYIRSEYPHADRDHEGCDRRAARRRARRQRARLGPCLRPGGARRRRRLCLRRGDLAARKPRRQARPGARQAAAAGAQGPVRQADGDQQRALARLGAVHPGRRAPRPMPSFGMGRSRGTMPIQLAGNVKHGGLFETAFGLTLGEIVDDIGGGTATGRPVKAVQVGGPLGAYFPRALFDTPFDYEAFAARDGLIGHGGIVVFDDTVDMAKQARFAMEFCAIEVCGKCTPCRIGSTRGVETIDTHLAGDRARREHRAARRPLQHDEVRLALRARRLHALSGDERAHAFPGGFRAARQPLACRPLNKGERHVARPRDRLRHPALEGGNDGHADHRRPERQRCREGTSIMRAAMELGTKIPKLCATDMLDAFGSCRLCLVEIEGRAGTPASCTTPVAPGMVVHTQTDRLKRLRRGVMELYISDHPLDCLTCAANGDCELQDMAGAVGLREVRYGYDGANHPPSRRR